MEKKVSTVRIIVTRVTKGVFAGIKCFLNTTIFTREIITTTIFSVFDTLILALRQCFKAISAVLFILVRVPRTIISFLA
jgi:hypothetical protein